MSLSNLLEQSKFISSAKVFVSAWFATWCRSFIHIKKSSGPKSEPWGTP